MTEVKMAVDIYQQKDFNCEQDLYHPKVLFVYFEVVKQTQTKDTKSSMNLYICIVTDVTMDAFTYVPVLCPMLLYINQNHE